MSNPTYYSNPSYYSGLESSMKAKKSEAKAITKDISCDCKCKFNSIICNSNQKQNNKTCQCECKNYSKCKKDYSWNPSTYICENNKCLKCIDETSVIECDQIRPFMDIVSTKMTIAIATNISKNSHCKNVRDCYTLHTVFLEIILILTIIFCYHYAKKKVLMH